MERDTVLNNIEDYTVNANIVKETVLEKLLNDKVISQEQFDTYNFRKQVVIVSRNWFHRWLIGFTKNKNDGYVFRYVDLDC